MKVIVFGAEFAASPSSSMAATKGRESDESESAEAAGW
jgi:hypothetical protein